MKLGFIGLGLIGARRAKIANALGHDIVFMVDPDPKRLDSLPMVGCNTGRSIAELAAMGGEKADVIFIAVPHDIALESCLWAFASGAHVLCEKPMGLDLAQAEHIAEAARAAGRRFCGGFNYRYLPGVSALRDAIHGGKLGQTFRVRMAIGHGGRPGMETEWKLKRARAGGGALIDPGIHLIDLALHLFGSSNVEATLLRRRFWPSDVEDECTLLLRNPDSGVDVTIEVSLMSWKNQFVIEAYGSNGQAVLTGRGGNYGIQQIEYINRWFWQPDQDRRSLVNLGSDDPSFELETRAFLDAIATGSDDGILSDAGAGCAALAVVQSAYAAAPDV